MKKVIISITLLFILAASSFAQTSTKITEKSQTDTTNVPIRILYKPEAAYPKSENGTVCVTGTVTLAVRFLDSGKIGTIYIINGLPYGLTESAVEAAKNIKFKPARKDGKAVTTLKAVTYSFTIY